MNTSIAALLLAVLCTPTFAAPPTTESVEALLTLTRAERTLETMYDTLEQSIRKGMRDAAIGRSLTSEQQRLLEALPARFAQVMREQLSWERVKPIHLAVYRETFEQHEIDGLIAFYSSSVGKAFAEKTPLVAQRTMMATQEQMKDFLPKFQQAMTQALAEAGIR